MSAMQSKWNSICFVLLYLELAGIHEWLQVAASPSSPSSPLPSSSSPSSSSTQEFRFASSNRHPVILVPGYQGSQLEVKLNGKSDRWSQCFLHRDRPELLWFQKSNYSPRWTHCWLNLVTLKYDRETKVTQSALGVDIQPRNFGSTGSCEFTSPNAFASHRSEINIYTANYFNSLVKFLVRRDYQRDVNIRGATYDWRRAPHENTEFMNNMKALIEDTQHRNGNTKVAILCHSMGCTFAYYFLRHQSQEWKDEYVRALIVTATPWDGNVKYLYSYLDKNDDLGASLFPVIRKAERSFSSLTFLLPHRRSFANDTLIQSNGNNFTVDDYEKLFTLLGHADAYEMWTKTSDLLGDFEHPEVDIYCLGATGVPTMSRVIYDQPFPNGTKRLLYEDGDGILLARSMRGCLRWQSTSRTAKKFMFKQFETTHMGLIQERTSVSFIYHLLQTL